MTSWIFAGVGALFMALAVPMIARRLRRNWWYGLRTVHTMSDDRVWYEANARSGRALFALGGVLVVLAILPVAPWVWLAVALAGTIGMAVWSMLLARSLHRELTAGDDGD